MTALATAVMLLPWLLVAGAAAQSGTSRAEVEITYPAPRAEVGEPIVVTFDVINASTTEEPRVPATPGLRSQVNRSRESSQMTIINGQVSQRVSIRYDVYFVAGQPGRFEIPRIRIVVDGQTYESRETSVEVTPVDLSRIARAEILVEPEHVVVGQNLTATLRLWIRNPRQSRFGPDAVRLWGSMVLPNESKWGIFQSAIEELYRESRFRQAPRAERDAEGEEWVIYDISTTLSPDKPGPFEVAGIEIHLRYPRANGGDRLLILEPTQPPVVVEEPPTEGRPADFAGAVGNFEIDASAKPTRAAVGDPITLSVVIVDRTPGGADLARLLPPPLTEQDDLERSFRMPSEPIVGSVNGRTKVFTQTLRALSERVTEIPPISFSFFDPVTERYRTVRSRPIPVTIMPTERIDTVAVTGGAASPSRPSNQPESKLTEVEGGIVASIRATPAMLAVDRVEPGWGVLAAIALPPLIAGAALLARRRAERLGSDVRIRQARTAPARARRAISAAADAPAIAAALKQYLADRSGLAAASLTRREALALLEAHDADDVLREEVDRILAAGERSAFAQSTMAPTDVRPDALRSEARQALARLDRLQLSPRSEATL